LRQPVTAANDCSGRTALLSAARSEYREPILADDFARQALEAGRFTESLESQLGDGRDAVAAEHQRRVQPDQPVNEPGAQQRGGEPAAAFDQQAGQATVAQQAKGGLQIDTPGRMRFGGDHDHSGIAQRLLTVGTDCALGKKYSALAITRAFKDRGVAADFRATGQTGILISGHGIPMDAVVSDFEAGAAEMLSPDGPPQHWDVIEGQGSLFHPSYAAVSLGLLHGSQADVLVVCHQAGRTHVLGKPDYPLPTLEETIELNLRLGSRTNPAIRCAGVSLNTSTLDADAARELLATEMQRLGLPVADPIRGGPEFKQLVDACLA